MITMETKPAVKPKQPTMENGPYLEKFEQFEKGAKGPAWVLAARKAGISHFAELGFPTLQDEDWRFTNVAPIARLPFKPVLEPKLAILDETDSGLDIDALKIVALGVNKLKRPDNAQLVITHYQRLLNYIVPDFVHVLHDGRIVRTGGKELALELEEKGYESIINRAAVPA